MRSRKRSSPAQQGPGCRPARPESVFRRGSPCNPNCRQERSTAAFVHGARKRLPGERVAGGCHWTTGSLTAMRGPGLDKIPGDVLSGGWDGIGNPLFPLFRSRPGCAMHEKAPMKNQGSARLSVASGGASPGRRVSRRSRPFQYAAPTSNSR